MSQHAICSKLLSVAYIPSTVIIPGAHGRARSLTFAAGRGGSAPGRGAAAAIPSDVVGLTGGIACGVAVPLLGCWGWRRQIERRRRVSRQVVSRMVSRDDAMERRELKGKVRKGVAPKMRLTMA